MFKILTILMFSLSGTQAFAQKEVKRINCKIKDRACEQGNACYSINSISKEEVVFTLQPILKEVLATPQSIKAIEGYDYFKISKNKFIASWGGGEHYIDTVKVDDKPGAYAGLIVLDQDFTMTVECVVSIVFLEKK